MISKKKFTALAVAGLFATPVLAETTVSYNSLQSDNGYLIADDELFSKALENSRNRDDSSKDAVKLTMWGSNSDNDGLTQLNLAGRTYDNVNFILFSDNSGQNNPHHRSTLNLTDTNLTLSRGIIFRNASNFIERNEDGSFDESKRKNLQNTSVLNLDRSSLTGDVINQYTTFDETQYFYQIGLKNNTKVSLTSSEWTGDLKDEINLGGTALGKPVDKNEAGGEYVVSLKEGSSWTGGVDVAKKSKVEVTLDGTSSWTVTKDSKVNSIQFENAATRRVFASR